MTKAGELGIGANSRYEDSETLLSNLAPSYSSNPNPADSFFKRTLLAKNHFERPAKSSFVPRTYLVLRILSALLSLVIVGMLAHAVSVYYSREEPVPADRVDEVITWPPKERFETAPTLLLLGAAATAALLSLAVVRLNFMKSTRGRRRLGNIVALVVGVVVVALAAAVAVVYKTTEAPWDLLSFTCAYGDAQTHDKVIDELKALCYQTRFGWYGGIAVGVLEVVALALAIVNWWFRAKNKGKGVYVPLAKKNNVAQQGNGPEHSMRLGRLAKPPPQQVGRPVHISNGYEYWEVDDVVEMRQTSAGAREYLVRWKGFSPSHDSWEPEEHLSSDWLQNFQDRTKRAKWAVDNTYWEVEEIADWRRPHVGATEYLIRWKGFSSDYDSWEPEGNVDASLVTEFKRRKGIA